MKKTPKPKAETRDIAILHGPTEDGKGARLLRFRGDTVTAGEIRPAREGQPLGPLSRAELVRLKPLHRELPVCEIEVLHAPPSSQPEAEPEAQPEAAPTRSGPARVSTQRYRRNWGAVFGNRTEREREREQTPRDDGPDYSVN